MTDKLRNVTPNNITALTVFKFNFQINSFKHKILKNCTLTFSLIRSCVRVVILEGKYDECLTDNLKITKF